MSSTAQRYPMCAKYPPLYPLECPKCYADSDSAALNNFVRVANNSTEYQIPDYSISGQIRTLWEKWDLRIQILYILYIQLYLLIFGRFRRRWKKKFLIHLNVWFLYILADLLAVVALGKLSEVNDEIGPEVNLIEICPKLNPSEICPEFNPKKICSPDKPDSLLRGLWAPIILFYLGGPDTLTLLRVEETQLWTRHLISLLTQGARACYVLIVTWTSSVLSVLSLLMLISGIIKYAERIWVIKSRTWEISKGSLKPNDCTGSSASPENKKQTDLVVEGYSCFQTLKPHVPGYRVPRELRNKFIKEGTTPSDIFKQIKIELGFMYDVLFSKVGTIFTAWGFILRFITLSCAVCVLVGFVMVDDKPTNDFEGDVQITIILLLGAIFLDIVGLLLQLVSDWAVVWASYHPQCKLSSPVLLLHELLISGRRRWSEEVGQVSLLNFCTKYKETAFNKTVRHVCGQGKLLSINSSSPSTTVNPTLKALIFNQVRERSQTNSGQTFQTSRTKLGEWTLSKYGLEQALEWTMNLEFGEAIVLWHLATDICYKPGEASDESEAAKIFSYYMMHLLLVCPHRLPFCNTYGDFWQTYTDIIKESFEEKEVIKPPSHAEACKLQKERHGGDSERITVKGAKALARYLTAREERWAIMSNIWVEMLCHAALQCELNRHAQELRHGGEFLTHVWLLLMHFGIYGDQENITPPDQWGTVEQAISNLVESMGDLG